MYAHKSHTHTHTHTLSLSLSHTHTHTHTQDNLTFCHFLKPLGMDVAEGLGFRDCGWQPRLQQPLQLCLRVKKRTKGKKQAFIIKIYHIKKNNYQFCRDTN